MKGEGEGGDEVGVSPDDDVDTDDQEEDQERQPLLCHPRPHLAPTGSKSAEGKLGKSEMRFPHRVKVKRRSCRLGVFVRARVCCVYM